MSNLGDYSRKVRKSFARRIVNYVLNGLLIAVPVAVTCYVIYNIFIFLDNLIPGEREYPGVGIVFLLLLLIVLGWAGTKFINEPIRRRLEKLLDRIPLIKTVYKSMTEVLGAFVGSKKRFDRPVLVKLSSEMDVEVIGFITDEDLSDLGKISNEKVAVYMPMSYSISGHLIIVPKKNVILIDKNAVDVMKYVISGGVVEIDHAEHHGKV
jgi:uncharacterized membrane protein